MFLEIERVAEKHGIPHESIPAFITDIAEVLSIYMSAKRVEDWHGKVITSEGSL
jgi:hypothetical protein